MTELPSVVEKKVFIQHLSILQQKIKLLSFLNFKVEKMHWYQKEEKVEVPCHFVNVTFHQLAASSNCRFANLKLFYLELSLICYFVNLHLAILSPCHLINLPLSQVTVSLTVL